MIRALGALLLLLLAWAPAAYAAIACTNPGKEDLTATQASFTFPASGSWTPVSGELVLVWALTRQNTGTAATPTLTGTNGWNVTWTQVATLTTGGSLLVRATLFRGVAASGTAGTFTLDHGGNNQLQAGVDVVSCSGVDQASSQGIVQSATDTSTNGTMASALAAFGDAANATAIGGVARGTPTAWAPEAGYTDSSYTVLGGITGIGAAWLASNDTTPTATLTSGTNTAGIAVEIKATVGGAAASPFFKRRILRY